MTITLEEQKDASEMAAQLTLAKLMMYENMKGISVMGEERLKKSGFKSYAEGYEHAFKVCETRCNKLIREFEMRWPGQK
jgi:hypothetical protein